MNFNEANNAILEMYRCGGNPSKTQKVEALKAFGMRKFRPLCDTCKRRGCEMKMLVSDVVRCNFYECCNDNNVNVQGDMI